MQLILSILPLLQEARQLDVAVLFVRLVAVAGRGKLVRMAQNAGHLAVRLFLGAEVATVLYLEVQIDLTIALEDGLLRDFGLVLNRHGHVVDRK